MNNQIVIYKTNDGQVKISVLFEKDNLWLTQKHMAELFETTIANINMHLKNIFKDNELDKYSVIKDFLITASDKKNTRQSTIL